MMKKIFILLAILSFSLPLDLLARDNGQRESKTSRENTHRENNSHRENRAARANTPRKSNNHRENRANTHRNINIR